MDHTAARPGAEARPSRDAPRPGRDAPPRMASYERERETFRVKVPPRFNAVRDILDTWAAETPDRSALVSIDGEGALVADQSI